MTPTRSTRQRHQEQRVLFLLLLVAVAVAIVAARTPRQGNHRPAPPQPPRTSPARPHQVAAPGEQRGELPSAREGTAGTETTRSQGPVAAIVIDDVGNNEADLQPFLALDYPLAFAVLPALPLSRSLAEQCRAQGREVLLHLPLQPQGSQAMGPGAIAVDMEPAAIRRAVRDDLASVPGATGVSNHMGSLATADRQVMGAVMQVVAERGLYFVDSLTTSRSQASTLAAEHGVGCLRRDLFLDPGRPGPDQVAQQVLALGELAKRRGYALGIGHVHPDTAQGLAAGLPRLEAMGVRLVSAGELAADRGGPGE